MSTILKGEINQLNEKFLSNFNEIWNNETLQINPEGYFQRSLKRVSQLIKDELQSRTDYASFSQEKLRKLNDAFCQLTKKKEKIIQNYSLGNYKIQKWKYSINKIITIWEESFEEFKCKNFEILCQKIKENNPFITVLDMTEQKLNTEQINQLIDVLKENNTIRSLKILGIKPEKAILDINAFYALACHSSIKELYLNQIGINGINNVFNSNLNLEKLNLIWSNFETSFLKNILEAIAKNKILVSVTLVVESNMLIEIEDTIESFNLSENKIIRELTVHLERDFHMIGLASANIFGTIFSSVIPNNVLTKLQIDNKASLIRGKFSKKNNKILKENIKFAKDAFECVKKNKIHELSTLISTKKISPNIRKPSEEISALQYAKEESLLQYAVLCQNSEAIKVILRSSDIKIELQDKLGLDTLDLARESNNKEIMRLLVAPQLFAKLGVFEESINGLEKDFEDAFNSKDVIAIQDKEKKKFSNINSMEREQVEDFLSPGKNLSEIFSKEMNIYKKLHEELKEKQVQLEKKFNEIKSSPNDEEIKNLKNEIRSIKTQQNILTYKQKFKEAQKAYLDALLKIPQLSDFYDALFIRLKTFIYSANAAAGPFINVAEGSLGETATNLEDIAKIAAAIPYVEGAEKPLNIAAIPLRSIDERRQKNLAMRIAKLEYNLGKEKIIHETARLFTECLKECLKKLVLFPEDKKETFSEKGKRIIFRKLPFSNPEKIADHVFAVIYDTLGKKELDFNKRSFSSYMIEGVLKKGPKKIEKAKKKLSWFFGNKVIEIQKEEGVEQHLIRDCIAKTAILTEEGDVFYRSKVKGDYETFGVCLVTKEIALGLMNSIGLQHVGQKHKQENRLSEGWKNIQIQT